MEEAGIIESKNSEIITDVQSMSATSSKTSYLISNGVLVAALIAVSLRILYKECYGRAIVDTVSVVSFFVLIFGSIEITIRVYRFCVELTQLNTKYAGDAEKVFKTLNLNNPSWIFVALSFGLFMILHASVGNSVDRVWSFGPLHCLPAFFISIIVCQIIGLKDSTFNTALTISSMGGVDYGTGMAYSYYYGYLQLVLPSDGGQNPGLRYKMEQYESLQKVVIPVKKLFILIPESGHIPPDLKEASDYWLESTTNLESEVLDRAGVKRRNYKNTVYKIHPGGDGKSNHSVYVTTEGATPMLTFWEILQHSHPQTAAYREHRQEIVASFYRTLQTLLDNDPRCRDACELVYYNDYDAKGKKVNVGEILLRRILSQTPSTA